MDGRTIAVVALFVGLPGSQVERASDLFVEQDIAHRVENIRVEAEREFARISRAGIGVEDFVEALGVVGAGADYLAIFKLETNIFEFRSGIKCRGIKLNLAVD